MDPARMRHRVKKNDPLRHLPLPELIETLYRQQFGRERPERILSVEAMAAEHLARREARKAAQSEAPSSELPDQVSPGNQGSPVDQVSRGDQGIGDRDETSPR